MFRPVKSGLLEDKAKSNPAELQVRSYRPDVEQNIVALTSVLLLEAEGSEGSPELDQNLERHTSSGPVIRWTPGPSLTSSQAKGQRRGWEVDVENQAGAFSHQSCEMMVSAAFSL